MVKIKIGTKLFFTYLFILLLAFSITAISFNLLSQRYLISEARQELRREGEFLAETFKNLRLNDPSVKEKLLARKELKVAGRLIESNIILFNAGNKIIYTNLEAQERRLLLNLLKKGKLTLRGYVLERIPVYDQKNALKGQLLLLTKVKELQAINSIMRRTQALSFVLAGFVALILGLIFGRSLTGPLNKLMESMTGFSIKNSNQLPKIKTGDEIEELASCFNQMAQKLKTYDEQQKRFLQNTSHELKTPLMSIQGYAEAIKDGVVEGEELAESLDIIIAESQRLKKVVEEIVYLTKLENIEEIFNFQKANLGEIIAQAVKSVKALAVEQGIQIQVKDSVDYTGSFDAEKLKRAFINILGNSIRYAKASIFIDVAAVNNRLQIEFSDDGPGFKAGEEKRVFDRFYKGDKGGSGLGLAITKAIVEGHGGTIEASNKTPTGAIFKLLLPLA